GNASTPHRAGTARRPGSRDSADRGSRSNEPGTAAHLEEAIHGCLEPTPEEEDSLYHLLEFLFHYFYRTGPESRLLDPDPPTRVPVRNPVLEASGHVRSKRGRPAQDAGPGHRRRP